jgi:hypothetical protein
VRSGIDCNQSEARNRLSSSWGALERAELGAVFPGMAEAAAMFELPTCRGGWTIWRTRFARGGKER